MDRDKLESIIDCYILEHGIKSAKEDINYILSQKKSKRGRPVGARDQLQNGLALIIMQLFGPLPYPPPIKLKLPKDWRTIVIKFINDNPQYKTRIFANKQKAKTTDTSWTIGAMKQALSREKRIMDQDLYDLCLAYRNWSSRTQSDKKSD